MSKINFGATAKKLRQAAAEHLDYQTELWSDEKDMLKMYKGDHKATLKIADLIEKGEVEKLSDALWSMDTDARESVMEMIEDNSPAFYHKHVWLD